MLCCGISSIPATLLAASNLAPEFTSEELPAGWNVARKEYKKDGVSWISHSCTNPKSTARAVVYTELRNKPSNWERYKSAEEYVGRTKAALEKSGYRIVKEAIPEIAEHDFSKPHISILELSSKKGNLYVLVKTLFSDYGHSVFISAENKRELKILADWSETLEFKLESPLYELAKNALKRGKVFNVPKWNLKFTYPEKNWMGVGKEKDTPPDTVAILRDEFGVTFVVSCFEHVEVPFFKDRFDMESTVSHVVEHMKKQLDSETPGLFLGRGVEKVDGREVHYFDVVYLRKAEFSRRYYFRENKVLVAVVTSVPADFFYMVEPTFAAMLASFEFE